MDVAKLHLDFSYRNQPEQMLNTPAAINRGRHEVTPEVILSAGSQLVGCEKQLLALAQARGRPLIRLNARQCAILSVKSRLTETDRRLSESRLIFQAVVTDQRRQNNSPAA